MFTHAEITRAINIYMADTNAEKDILTVNRATRDYAIAESEAVYRDMHKIVQENQANPETAIVEERCNNPMKKDLNITKRRDLAVKIATELHDKAVNAATADETEAPARVARFLIDNQGWKADDRDKEVFQMVMEFCEVRGISTSIANWRELDKAIAEFAWLFYAMSSAYDVDLGK